MSFIQGDDKHSKFYTGFSWNVVLHLYQFLSPMVDPSRAREKEDEFFLLLVRLRLGLHLEDLAYRFGITNASVTRIIQKWLEVMYHRLQFLIYGQSERSLDKICQWLSSSCIPSACASLIALKFSLKHLPISVPGARLTLTTRNIILLSS